jgi:allantoinase
MPLNSDPPVLDGDTFAAKRVAAEAQSTTDFALWGGLTPKNLDRLEELRDCGVIGLKAFMSHSGIAEFPRVDEKVLHEGMKRAADLDLLVAVHAEDEEITATIARAEEQRDVRAYLDSRPIRAECAAIEMALEFAGETGCRLHIVHVSSAAGVRLVTEAKARGVDVTCETCPHYLVLSENDVFTIGAAAKCAPPLRSPQERDALVEVLFEGQLETLGSDHSPAPPTMKTGDDFFAIWGGISGAQHLLPLMLDLWHRSGSAAWPLLGRLLSTNVGRRFRLPDAIGQIVIGSEANLAVVDLAAEDTVEKTRLHYRHPMTPYAGRTLHGKVVRTLLRGQTIAEDGRCIGQSPAGRLIQPIHQ